MENNFNWELKHLGKKVVDENGSVGKFIGRCETPSFTIDYDDGHRLTAGIGSLLGKGWKLCDKMSLKTLKDFYKIENALFSNAGEKNKGFSINSEEIKQEAIKWIKAKLKYLKAQPSIFKLKSINLVEKNIVFCGLSPQGTPEEERAKGWVMGFIFFYDITMEDLKNSI